MQQRSNAGFTLIELLVVISLIALLLAILLPSLGTARRSAQLIQSISNLRQIGIGSSSYAADNDGFHPMVPTGRSFGSSPPATVGWCTWSFGGKFSDAYWATRSSGYFDLAPSARPLNEYIYSGIQHPAVTGTGGYNGPARPANDSERAELDFALFKSPRDIASMQRSWPNVTPGISSFDDVGTSYHSNKKWVQQLSAAGYSIDEAFEQGNRQIRIQAGLDPSRFVLYHDQVADVILNPWTNNGLSVVDGEYGHENQSAMTFIDGHAGFILLEPGEPSGDDYTFEITQP